MEAAAAAAAGRLSSRLIPIRFSRLLSRRAIEADFTFGFDFG